MRLNSRYYFGLLQLGVIFLTPIMSFAKSAGINNIAIISADQAVCEQVLAEIIKIPILKKANPIGNNPILVNGACFTNERAIDESYDFSLEILKRKNGSEELIWQPLSQEIKDEENSSIYRKKIVRIANNQVQRNKILLHFYQVSISTEWNDIYHFTLQQKINPDGASGEEKIPPHYLDTLSGLIGSLGVGALWYYVELATNSQDFQINNFWDSLKLKLTDTKYYGFDDNAVPVNVGHALSGSIFYQFARSNHFTRFESFLWALATSSVWEYGIEFREVMSLNDQIFTPLGGMIIGEVLYQFSQFFAKQDSALGKVLSGIFCPACKIHGFAHKEIDDGYPPGNFTGDALFISFDYKEFKGAFEKSLVELSAGFQGRINHYSNQRPTEQLAYWSSDALWDEISLALHLSPIQMQLGVDFLAKTALAGFVAQNSSKNDNYAYRFVIAPISAVDINSNALPGQTAQDFFATVDVIGSNIQVDGYIGLLKIKFSMDIFASFGMVKSLALSEFTGHYPSLESTLAKRGYSWSLGPKVNSKLGLSYGPIDINFNVQGKEYNSIDGFDGRRSEWTDPMAKERSNRDGLYSFGAELGLTPSKLPLMFVLGVKVDHRFSEMEDIDSTITYQSVEYSFSAKGKW